MSRKIPATMATQHPDHASKPYWHNTPFIAAQFETQEVYLCYSELGIPEYKWDWEGKLVDESVLERLFSRHFDFFKKYPLGVDTFLTFRLPNPKVETEFRIGRCFMNLAAAASIAKHFKLPSPPLFEVILPMTTSAEEMLSIQEAYIQMHQLTHPLYRLEGILTNPRIIPLFEDVPTIIDSDKILQKYLTIYKKKFKKLPPYMRPYVARSDPALNFGIVPTVLAIKIALSRYSALEHKTGIPLYPIIGGATLPFRGGLNPLQVDQFIKEYKGIKTTTIQSAFRYDFDKQTVIKAIAKLNKTLPLQSPENITEEEEKEIQMMIPVFENYYQEVIEKIGDIINQVAAFLPPRRERVQHTGLYGYSRGVGKVRLPRAIGFTASLYSIGIPPELIGTGRGLTFLQSLKQLDLLLKYYKFIKEDLQSAAGYLNSDNLKHLSKSDAVWEKVLEDVRALEKILGIQLGPRTTQEKEHQRLTAKIYANLKSGRGLETMIEKAALLRRSLG